jgi:protein involved in polysaccharide export with SLBB domain
MTTSADLRYIFANFPGVLVHRKQRFALAVSLVMGWMLASPLCAQLTAPLQEQIQIFRSLPPAQQQALIRELERQLPPDQREAYLNMLLAEDGGEPELAELSEDVDIDSFASELSANFLEMSESEDEEGLAAGDTLVVAFQTGEGTPAGGEFLDRIKDSNPYVLDDAGRLLLPGIPAIALAGLNIEQAMIRVGAERSLREYTVVLTHLPLEPVGTAALEPFGHDVFKNARSTFFAPATDVNVTADYVVGPGDSLSVLLTGNQNSQYFLDVQRDGTINFPEIGSINVSGLTFPEVRNLISERVSEQMIGVRASTTLGELRSIRVYVLGEVRRPGSFTVNSLSKMAHALLASGGVTEIGTLRRIELKRAGVTVETLDLYDILLRGDMSGNERLQPEDTIFVPTVGSTVAVDGEVRRPAIYELRDGETAADLIELAGGLRASADPGEIRLERIVPGRGVSVVDVNLAAAAGGDMALRDGDVLRVAGNLDQIEDSVRLVGNVQREGLYQWREGMTVSDLLPGPELVRPQSDLRYVLIRREPTANVEVEALSVDLEAVWAGRLGAADLALMPRDTVHVFHLETGRQQYVGPIVEEIEAQAGPGEPMPVVRIGGRVRAEGRYPLEPGMRLSDLLRAGGGLTDAAYAVEAELTRYQVVDGAYRQADLLTVDLAAVRAGASDADVALSPYDYLTIRQISGWDEQAVVTLVGEFKFPGDYPIRPGETMTSVLARAGGMTEFAFAEGSVFTRVDAAERERAQYETMARRVEAELAALALSEEGASDTLETGQAVLAQIRNTAVTGRTVIRLDEILAGRSETSIEMRNGDVLYVPKANQEVTVIGEVQYPTTHIYSAGLDRDGYIARSGGVTRRADNGRIYIVRANGEVVTDSGGRWFRRDAGFEVRPGDTIVAPLDVTRMRPLTLWTSVTQIMYNMAIAAAAVSSF